MSGVRSGAAARRRPVIATNLSPLQNARLADHWSKPRVVPYADAVPVWEVPPDADILMTFFRGWREAPRTRPPGWPHRLGFIQVAAAGIDAFPAWFFAPGVPVSCGRGVSADAIAEFVMMAVLAHEKRAFDGLRIRSRADWTQSSLGGLSGRSIGLLGFGAIGQAVARRALPFGVRLRALRRTAAPMEVEGVDRAGDLSDLVATSDHLVAVAAATPETRQILGREAFAAARPGLHLVNVSRGELIDQDALLEALDQGQVAAATLDTTTPEPLPDGHPFYAHPRVRLSPHVSWMSEDNDDRMTGKLFANLDRHLRGEELLDLVDAARGY